MAATLEQLMEQVQINTQVEQSAITLIQGIAAQLEACKDDPEQIQGLVDQLKDSADALGAAVLANTQTPVEPPVEEPPVETPVEPTPVEEPPTA